MISGLIKRVDKDNLPRRRYFLLNKLIKRHEKGQISKDKLDRLINKIDSIIESMTHWTQRKSRVTRVFKVDYTEVFKAEKNELASLNLLAGPNLSEADNRRMIDELKSRRDLIDLAIEQLRVKRHAVDESRDEHIAQLPSHRQKEVAELDATWRQKKALEKIDSGLQVKRAQAAGIERAMRDCGSTSEEIRAVLMKKGLI